MTEIVTRNEVLGFAERTRRNLEYIEEVKAEDPTAPVHVVTQLALSLLGIVVFPYEKLDKDIFAKISGKTIAEMKAGGWLGWSITLDSSPAPTTTLGDLLKHVRNAAAHGGLLFNSDSTDMSEVAIVAQDKPRKKAAINWEAEIQASQLRDFCLTFLKLVDDVVS